MGFAKSSYYKSINKKSSENPKRQKYIDECGYDAKDGLHAIRILDELYQFMSKGTMELKNSSSILKDIKLGKIPIDKYKELYYSYMEILQDMEMHRDIPDKPRNKEVKELLKTCLEMGYYE